MPKQGLSRLLSQIKTDDWLSRMIDLHQDKMYPERWVDADPTIHPSSSSSCARDVELGFLGYRGKIPAKNRRRMDNGTDTHTRWDRYFEDLGILYASELNTLSTDPLFNGTCDLIIQNPLDGKYLVGEIKTMNEARWKKVPEQMPDHTRMMRTLMLTEKPYVYQLTKYFVMIPKIHQIELSGGFFLFENTNTQEYKIRYVQPDEKLKKEAFETESLAQESFFEGKLIDPPYSRTSPACTRCYKKDICFRLQDGDEDAWLRVNQRLAGQ